MVMTASKISEEDKDKLNIFRREVESGFQERKSVEPTKSRLENYDFTMEQSWLAPGAQKANNNILNIIDLQKQKSGEGVTESEVIKQAGKNFADKLFSEFEKDETEVEPGRKSEPEKNLKTYYGNGRRILFMVSTPLSIPILAPVLGGIGGAVVGGTRAAVKVNEKVEHSLPRMRANIRRKPEGNSFEGANKQVEVVLDNKAWNEDGKVKTKVDVVTEGKNKTKTPNWQKKVRKAEARVVNGTSRVAENVVIGGATLAGVVGGGVVGAVAGPFIATAAVTARRSECNSSNFPVNRKATLTPKNHFIENYAKEQSGFVENLQSEGSCARNK